LVAPMMLEFIPLMAEVFSLAEDLGMGEFSWPRSIDGQMISYSLSGMKSDLECFTASRFSDQAKEAYKNIVEPKLEKIDCLFR